MTILTDEEIKAINWQQGGMAFARAIEAAVIERIKSRGADTWAIRYQSPDCPVGLLSVHYHGTNAIADYRRIDPNATVTPLYRIED